MYGNYFKYCEPSIREPFLEQVNAAVDWLYGEGEKAPLSDYQQKLSDFQAVAEPVKARYRYYSTV